MTRGGKLNRLVSHEKLFPEQIELNARPRSTQMFSADPTTGLRYLAQTWKPNAPVI